jgi:preprotein translocase subunit SecD
VAAALCVGFLAPLAVARPDEKEKVRVEFKRAETKPTDGYVEATIEGTNEKVYLLKRADATGADIAKASAGTDDNNNPLIEIEFTKDGAKKIAALSEAQQNKRIAIVIDGKVVSAPLVRAKIGSRAQITGKFEKQEVERIIKAINAK